MPLPQTSSTPTDGENEQTLSLRLAARLRERIISGDLLPGQRLSESALASELDVSRNTLREAFRYLTKDGLLNHRPNRGVFVAIPDHASIIDIYRVRRMVELRALSGGHAGHPAAGRMREAVERARKASQAGDWRGVGSANMAFHSAIVDLADSGRLASFYEQVAAELRLAFGLMDDPRFLHAPFVEQNAAIVEHLEAGRPSEATALLEDYLLRSETMVLGAFSRAVDRRAGR